MAISYDKAIDILKEHSNSTIVNSSITEEVVAINHALHRISKYEHSCPTATPAFDTSAMDGYALNSEITADASESRPILLRIVGAMAAGDKPMTVCGKIEHGVHPCVEIATGAQFPKSTDVSYTFDACVRLEDIERVSGPVKDCCYITVLAPVKKNENRRFAGSDFQEKDILVQSHKIIRPQQIMALANSGIDSVTVMKKPRAAVWSTGSELQSYHSCVLGSNQIRDVNGPYITSALEELGVEADFLGVVEDDPAKFSRTIKKRLTTYPYDLVITTGAVSKGRKDFVRQALESLGADIQFHNVAVRPGHPILFATLSVDEAETVDTFPTGLADEVGQVSQNLRKVAVFGIPGNPIAAAACFRFFVMPYLRFLTMQAPEMGLIARLSALPPLGDAVRDGFCSTYPNPTHLETFRHGYMWRTEEEYVVAISKDQGSSKIKPWLLANCWVQIPRGHGEARPGDSLRCFRIHS